MEQVAKGYQVPIHWLGDALCNFGAPPPIRWGARIADLVDGEAAFQLLEAIWGWDHTLIFDMYSWESISELAYNHDLEVGDVLRVCDEENFVLPFGARTRLRVEHHARLMRRLGLGHLITDSVRGKHPDPDYS